VKEKQNQGKGKKGKIARKGKFFVSTPKKGRTSLMARSPEGKTEKVVNQLKEKEKKSRIPANLKASPRRRSKKPTSGGEKRKASTSKKTNTHKHIITLPHFSNRQ